MPAADPTAEVARRLAALPEPAMRRHVLAERLAAMAPEQAVDLAGDLVARGRVTGPPFEIAMLALVRLLGDGVALPYEAAAAMYAAARRRGRDDVAFLFFSAPPRGEPAPQSGDVLAGRDGKPLTLGERKSLARGSRRLILERLLRDPDPAVIRILLGNPRLCERDVVRLAALRPARASVLGEVFAAERWLARYAVKSALAANPWSPPALAVRLLPFLRRREVRALAGDATLPAEVRRAAVDRLEPAGGS